MAAAAAGGPGPGGGGRRGARAATATNILAQLRHGQLSGRGLTRGAQVRDGGGWAGGAGPGVGAAGGSCGHGRGAGLGLRRWAGAGRRRPAAPPDPSPPPPPPPPAAGLEQGLQIRLGALARKASLRRGLGAGVWRPLGGAEHRRGAVGPLLEPRDREEPGWPGGACRQVCSEAVSGKAASLRPDRSARWGSPSSSASSGLVLVLEGWPCSLTRWGRRLPLCLRAAFPSFPPSVSL